MRVVKVDPSDLADCLFLIGQAWLKRGAKDTNGAVDDLAAAMRLVPPGAVEAILFMIQAGELPEPGPDPAQMGAWLEQCRQAGAGDLRMTFGYVPAEPPPDRRSAEMEFLARLAQVRAEAEARHGTLAANAPAPEWLGSLADELRAMGWM